MNDLLVALLESGWKVEQVPGPGPRTLKFKKNNFDYLVVIEPDCYGLGAKFILSMVEAYGAHVQKDGIDK